MYIGEVTFSSQSQVGGWNIASVHNEDEYNACLLISSPIYQSENFETLSTPTADLKPFQDRAQNLCESTSAEIASPTCVRKIFNAQEISWQGFNRVRQLCVI